MKRTLILLLEAMCISISLHAAYTKEEINPEYQILFDKYFPNSSGSEVLKQREGSFVEGKFNGSEKDILTIYPDSTTSYEIEEGRKAYDRLIIKSKYSTTPDIIIDKSLIKDLPWNYTPEAPENGFSYPPEWNGLTCAEIDLYKDYFNLGEERRDALYMSITLNNLSSAEFIYVINDEGEWEPQLPINPYYMSYDECVKYWDEWQKTEGKDLNTRIKLGGVEYADRANREIQVSLFPAGSDPFNINHYGEKELPIYVMKTSGYKSSRFLEGYIKKIFAIEDNESDRELVAVEYEDIADLQERRLEVYRIECGNAIYMKTLNGKELLDYEAEDENGTVHNFGLIYRGRPTGREGEWELKEEFEEKSFIIRLDE